MKLPEVPSHPYTFLRKAYDWVKVRKLNQKPPRLRSLKKQLRLPFSNQYQRVYHYHLRKSGGTSLNFSFFAHDVNTPLDFYKKLQKAPAQRLLGKRLVFAGWNRSILRSGNYHYGFSHCPAHEITLPPLTFTYTCLRDPVARVLSHYNMLLDFKKDPYPQIELSEESKWLGNSFSDFLNTAPRQLLLNQLYFWSKNFNTEEAFKNIKTVDQILFLENLEEGLSKLSKRLNIQLMATHENQSQSSFIPSEKEKLMLQALLEPEYKFLAKVRTIRSEGI